MRKRPNLLFICVDDLRPELDCYGREWMHTPHIDQLAATGRRFERHYVQAATCGASRYALLSGLRPRIPADYSNKPFEVNREQLLERPTESFAHLFKQHGYTTVCVWKSFSRPSELSVAKLERKNQAKSRQLERTPAPGRGSAARTCKSQKAGSF